MTLEERVKALRREFYSPSGDESELDIIARHMREAIAEEREACAKIADRAVLASSEPNCAATATWVSNQIRARGEE